MDDQIWNALRREKSQSIYKGWGTMHNTLFDFRIPQQMLQKITDTLCYRKEKHGHAMTR